MPTSVPKHNLARLVTSAIVKNGPGIIYGILITNNPTTDLTVNINIYDNTEADGDPKISGSALYAGQSRFISFEKLGGIPFNTAIYADISNGYEDAAFYIWYD